MTVPPGDPYGQDPTAMNPYGPGPAEGSQPQPGGYPYPPPGADPQAHYPPQQYPAGPYGASPPGGWPTGPYAPPPKKPRSQLPWLIGIGIAVLVVIGLVVTLAIKQDKGGASAPSIPTSAARVPSGAATPTPDMSAQTATDCTPNVSAGTSAADGRVNAGGLSFPLSAAPGWQAFGDNSLPNAVGAVGVLREVPGASKWIMQADVAQTNFVTSMDIAAQASKLMACVASGPGYADASPTLGPTTTSSLKIDGTDAARVDADITIGDPSRGVAGDSVVIIAVKTTPVTFFLGDTPIGDADSRATIDGIIAALKVTKN